MRDPIDGEIGAIFRQVAGLLPRYSYRMSNELAFQAGLAHVLKTSGIAFEREFVAGPADRFDFLIAGSIVIEAKVRGSISPALSQIQRYANRPDVAAVILVTTRHWGTVCGGVEQVAGKPVCILQVRGGAF